MLGILRMTIYRRRVEFVLISEPENVPTDMQLLTVLKEVDGRSNVYGDNQKYGLQVNT